MKTCKLLMRMQEIKRGWLTEMQCKVDAELLKF